MSPSVCLPHPGVCPSATLLCLSPEEASEAPRQTWRRPGGDQEKSKCFYRTAGALSALCSPSRMERSLPGSSFVGSNVSITPHQPQTPVSAARPSLWIRSGGVNSLNIRPLDYSRCPLAAIYTTAKVALVNSRSVSNKTLVLNDFFSHHNLDFLFLNRDLDQRWSWPVFCFRRTLPY